MKIAISIDSVGDLSKDLIEKYNVSVLPFTVNLETESKLDGIDINGKELLDYVEKSGKLPKTSAPSELAYENHFSNLLKEYDCVIHFSISNELSVAYSNAVRIAKNFDNKVKVIDTRALSSGIALATLYACDLRDEGVAFDDIVKKCEEIVPFIQTSFTLDNLNMLHKGGRCSGTAKLLSMALAIKPSLSMKDGKLVAHKKYLLTKFPVVVKKYVRETLEEFNDYDKTRVFITHTPTSKEIVDNVREMLKGKFDEILECDAGATISSHCGANTLGILYINKKR